MFCPNCGTENSALSAVCKHCGKPLSDTEVSTVSGPDYSKKLGWHKFLINFAFFAGALLDISNGIQYLTGSIYGDEAAFIYMAYETLQGLDIAYGLFSIGIAAYLIYVRFQISGFKIGAIKKLAIVYTLNFVVTPLYMGFADLATGLSLLNESNIGSIIGSLLGTLIFAVINIVYYNKRKCLFVN